jgi:hypothetical protein
MENEMYVRITNKQTHICLTVYYTVLYLSFLHVSTPTRHSHGALIRTNDPVSTHALHILNNRHEYGRPGHSVLLLLLCDKGKMMNCW